MFFFIKAMWKNDNDPFYLMDPNGGLPVIRVVTLTFKGAE